MSISYNYRNKNNFSKLYNSFLFIISFPTLSLIVGFIVFINNRSENLRLNKIPNIEKNIIILKDQKIIALKKKDFLIRNYIKDQAKKNGMIKPNYSKNIIKW
tara:strand:- start:2289 stop:2594 length:306 start_codon:yes stop_codon:yes gene_type:complete